MMYLFGEGMEFPSWKKKKMQHELHFFRMEDLRLYMHLVDYQPY